MYEIIQTLFFANPYYTGLSILAILAILYIRNSAGNTINKTTNKYIINAAEILPDVSYYTYRPDQIRNLIWTGDLQSTWLLCYYFIAAEQPVQLIYFTANQHHSSNTRNLALLMKIRNQLIARYPHKKNRLLPTYYVTNISKNTKITQKINRLKHKNPSLGQESSLIESAARFASDWPYPMYLAINAQHPVTQLFANDPLVSNIENNSISTNDKTWDLAIPNQDYLQNIRLPILHLTTDYLIRFSLDSKHYFYDILLMTINNPG
jgi:hypothetical protein